MVYQGGRLAYTIQNLTPSTAYSFTVTASNGTYDSEVSQCRSATTAAAPVTITQPSEPRNVTVQAVDHQRIEISWQSSLDNGGGTLTYIVRQYDGDSCISNERVVYQGGGLAYTIQNLAPSTAYSFTVTASNGTYDSEVSQCRSATTAAAPVTITQPSEPRNVTVQAVDHQEITVSWQSSLDNGGGTLTYIVRQYDGDSCLSNERVVYQRGGLAYTIQNLTPNTAYSFTVTASNGTYDSEVSQCRSATTAAAPVTITQPSEPRNVTVQAVDHQEITVSWQSSLDNGGGTLTYIVRQYDGDSCISNERVVYQGGGLAYTIQNLTPNTAYSFTVTASNGTYDSEVSQCRSATTNPAPVTITQPSFPRNVALRVVDHQRIEVSWDPPLDDGGGTLIYTVRRYRGNSCLGGVTTYSAGGVTTYTVRNLNADTLYSFTVVASNGTRTSNPSVCVATATDLAPIRQPSVPRNVVAETVSHRRINVSWDRPLDDGGDPLTYTVWRYIGNSCSGEGTTRSTVRTTYGAVNLNADTTYSFRVTASNGTHTSNPSLCRSATTDVAPIPRNVMVESRYVGYPDDLGIELEISWDPPFGEAVSRYIIEFFVNETCEGYGSSSVDHVTSPHTSRFRVGVGLRSLHVVTVSGSFIFSECIPIDLSYPECSELNANLSGTYPLCTRVREETADGGAECSSEYGSTTEPNPVCIGRMPDFILSRESGGIRRIVPFPEPSALQGRQAFYTALVEGDRVDQGAAYPFTFIDEPLVFDPSNPVDEWSKSW